MNRNSLSVYPVLLVALFITSAWSVPTPDKRPVPAKPDIKSQLEYATQALSDPTISTEDIENVYNRYSDVPMLHIAARFNFYNKGKQLLEEGFDPNEQFKGITPLQIACLFGYQPFAKLLLKHGADAQYMDANSRTTPLHLAVVNEQKQLVQLLIDHGADVNAATLQGVLPIHIAAVLNDTNLLELLSNNNADINALDEDNRSPLLYALRHKAPDAAQWLLDHEADIHIQDKNGEGPLYFAAALKEPMLTKELIARHANVNQRTKENETPLHNAARFGRTNIVKILIDNGAGIDAREEDGDTPFLKTAIYNELDTAKVLVDAGADIHAIRKSSVGAPTLAAYRDFQDYVRWLAEIETQDISTSEEWGNALVNTIRHAHIEMVDLLLELGVSPTPPHTSDYAPLHYAVYFNVPRIFTRLLQAGADTESRNINNDTPLIMASTKQRTNMVGQLLTHNAEINAKGRYGDTALHRAARKGDLGIAQLLIEQGADIQIVDDSSFGFTPLFEAIQNTNQSVVAMIQLFADNGTDINSRNKRNRTPLHSASLINNTNAITKLLEMGAEINAIVTDGSTPLIFAAQKQHPDSVRLLVEHGADVNICVTNGESALSEAAFWGTLEVCQCLVEHGAILTDTTLYNAMLHNHDDIVTFLKSKGLREEDVEPELFEIDIYYENAEARTVSFANNLNYWSDWMGKMERQPDGKTWHRHVRLPAGEHPYKFIVDGNFIMDPCNRFTTNHEGIENSLLSVPEMTNNINRTQQPVPIDVQLVWQNAMDVSIVGEFNSWNKKTNPMTRNTNGTWETTLELLPGQYGYKFAIDELPWIMDPANPDTRVVGGVINSCLTVPSP